MARFYLAVNPAYSDIATPNILYTFDLTDLQAAILFATHPVLICSIQILPYR